MDSTLVRVLQLVLAVLGILFSTQFSSNSLIVIAFAVALVYLCLVFVGILVSRTLFPGRVGMLFDLVIGVVVLVMTVIVTIQAQSSSTYWIISIVCGYILGPLLIITGSAF